MSSALAVVPVPVPVPTPHAEVSATVPTMNSAALLLLDDPINVQIVVTWALVPEPIRLANSIYDMASYSARVSGCDIDTAVSRIHALLGMKVIAKDGSVNPVAQNYLHYKAEARLNGLKGGDAATIAARHVGSLSSDQLAEFLNAAAPRTVRELDWTEEE